MACRAFVDVNRLTIQFAGSLYHGCQHYLVNLLLRVLNNFIRHLPRPPPLRTRSTLRSSDSFRRPSRFRPGTLDRLASDSSVEALLFPVLPEPTEAPLFLLVRQL